MKTIEKQFPDAKKDLPEGPWQLEPDKMQWEDPETKLPCLIVRNHSGNLCGYVGVAEGHPFYEKRYSDVSPEPACHGGLSFSNFCQEDPEGICHLPEPGEPDKVWWFGFDCAHGGDIIPSFLRLEIQELGIKHFTGKNPYMHETYKDILYVKNEVRLLAKQLAEIK